MALAVAVPIATADREHGSDHGHKQQHGHGNDRAIDAAIARHLDNVEDCDAKGLVNDYTDDARLLPERRRRERARRAHGALRDLRQAGRSARPGGLRLAVVDRFRKGQSAIVKVEVTADFLAEPYFSTDSYVFHHGRIAGEVSTFDAAKLKFK